MIDTETVQQQEQSVQESELTLKASLPFASPYMLELLEYKTTEPDLSKLALQAKEYKESLSIPQDLNADDLIIQILLFRQSADSAKRRVDVLKSQKALTEIASYLELDDSYLNLLINHYASVSNLNLFINDYPDITAPALPPVTEEKNPEISKIINALIESAQQKEVSLSKIAADNREYITALHKDKKILSSLYLDLCDAYCTVGAEEFAPLFEEHLSVLAEVNDNPSLNASLACKVCLSILSISDAEEISALDKAMPYRLLEDDLQIIAFKYLKLKTVKDAADTLEAVLKRLSCADSPVENLGLAVRVVADARLETLQEAEAEAEHRRGKIFFMRKIAGYKFFSGYEDEITTLFYPDYSIEQVISSFNSVLRELPCNSDIYENSDIGIKVLLKKLPLKDAKEQSKYRKQNKSDYSADALENEAINGYLGTKNREDVLSAMRSKLHPYTFWRNDEDKHCYALNIVLEELNGNTSTFWADTSLVMLEKGYPEESIDIIMKGLSSTQDLTSDKIISAYEKFYASGNNHKDAAMRVVNMLQ